MYKQPSTLMLSERESKKHLRKTYHLRFPDGMMNFIDKFLSTDPHLKIQDMCSIGGQLYKEHIDMRITYYRNLILTLLNTSFQDQTVYKTVRDLPLEDRLLLIDCLSYNLGMNPHNGNIHLLEIYERFPDLREGSDN